MKNQAIQERNSKFELLRILSMIMIVFYHLCYHGIKTDTNWSNGIALNKYFILLSTPCGPVAVFLFFIVTGYFLSAKQPNSIFEKIKRLKPVFEAVYFYAVLIFVTVFTVNTICNNSGGGTVKKAINIAILPINRLSWWFVSIYIVVFLLSDFINNVLFEISNSSKSKYLLFTIYILLYALPSFFGSFFWEIEKGILGYSIGYFFRYKSLKIKKLNTILLLMTTWVFVFGLEFLGISFSKPLLAFLINGFEFSILFPVISILIFNLFITIPDFYCKNVNLFAKATFAVYLIHDNGLRYYLWKFLRVQNLYNSGYFILWSCFIVFMIYTMASIFEIFRIKLFLFVRNRLLNKE